MYVRLDRRHRLSRSKQPAQVTPSHDLELRVTKKHQYPMMRLEFKAHLVQMESQNFRNQ